MEIKKGQFKVRKGTDWEKYHFETSADQVKFKKTNGEESELQAEIEDLQSKLGNLLKPVMVLDSTLITQNRLISINKGVKNLLLLELSNSEETGRALELFIPGISVMRRICIVHDYGTALYVDLEVSWQMEGVTIACRRLTTEGAWSDGNSQTIRLFTI